MVRCTAVAFLANNTRSAAAFSKWITLKALGAVEVTLTVSTGVLVLFAICAEFARLAIGSFGVALALVAVAAMSCFSEKSLVKVTLVR